MNPSTSIMEPAAPTLARPFPGAPPGASTSLLIRLGVTSALLVGYYAYRESLVPLLTSLWQSLTGTPMATNAAAAWLVAAMLVSVIVLWFDVLRKDKRFYAPLLITSILLLGDAAFGILENHSSELLVRLTGGYIENFSPTFIAIFTTIAAEMLLGRFFYGKWPHLASAYVSGISAGILIKSPATWPFILCGLISITSKYVLRIGDRHLWNPTNLGVTAMLHLAPAFVASLSVQAGNETLFYAIGLISHGDFSAGFDALASIQAWSVVIIWILGGMILWQLGRLHIPLAFIAAFLPLSLVRAWWTGHEVPTELAPMTSPMFQQTRVPFEVRALIEETGLEARRCEQGSEAEVERTCTYPDRLEPHIRAHSFPVQASPINRYNRLPTSRGPAKG